MIEAAGIMFMEPGGSVLLLKRGPEGDWPGAWCFPGGRSEGDETPEQAACREAREELGFLPEGDRTILTRRIAANGAPPPLQASDQIMPQNDDSVDFVTFLQRVPARFDPEINGEHTGFAWVLPESPPDPLHPGCSIALSRLGFNELDIARAMAAGELTSPQFYQNVWLFDIRITGTGAAYRSGIEEHVWRDPALYLNDDFLARCNGLAVIWEHPKKSTLNSEEFAARNIGAVMLPYIKGDEVWAISKIYDAQAAADMDAEQLSTSPAVVFRDPAANSTVRLEDGSKLLIETAPDLLDHIAICPLGVWDKGGDPTGVRSDSVKETTMPEETEAEKKAREDKARKDAEGGNIDKILSHLDSFGKRFDNLDSRMDAMEMAGKARKDAEEAKSREDGQKRRDAEREPWMKADAAECARDDAEEDKEREEHEKKGEPKEVAADKARKDRKDRMDARRKDSEAKEKERADAEDKARKDAQTSTAKMIADAVAAALPRQASDADRSTMADAQARADAAYGAFGQRAPQPLQGELVSDYRRRLAKPLQKHGKWSGTELHGLSDDVFAKIEPEIYADAVVASKSAVDLPEGELIPMQRTDPHTGHRITEFRGRNTFIMGLKRPSMRVTGFKTEKRA